MVSIGQTKPGLDDRARNYAEYRASGKGKAESATLAGYPAKSASTRAYKLEKKPAIQALIAELQQQATAQVLDKTDIGREIRERAAEMTETEAKSAIMAGQLTAELASTIFVDPLAIWRAAGFGAADDGEPLADLTPEERRSVAGLKQTTRRFKVGDEMEEETVLEIKMRGRDASTKMLLDRVDPAPINVKVGGKVDVAHKGFVIHMMTPNNGRGPVPEGAVVESDDNMIDGEVVENAKS